MYPSDKLKNLFRSLFLFGIILITFMTACAPIAMTAVAPTVLDVTTMHTQTAGTIVAVLTQQPIATPTHKSLSQTLCRPPSVHETPNYDRSNQGYFSGVLTISEYYTLLSSGLQEEAYKLLSADAQKAYPRSQYVETQKKNMKTVQIIIVEPLIAWNKEQGIKNSVTDLVNRINFYVQIRVSAAENTPASLQTGDLQTLYLTLVLTEPEHLWKIDTFATKLVRVPDYAGPIPYAAFSSEADHSYYDALVSIGRHNTFFNHGFYEQAYQLYSTSSAHSRSLEQYLADIQLLKIKVNRVVQITPLYPAQWQLPCLTSDEINRRTFSVYIYAEGENGWAGSVPNGLHSSFMNMVLEHGEWKIYSVNSMQQ